MEEEKKKKTFNKYIKPNPPNKHNHSIPIYNGQTRKLQCLATWLVFVPVREGKRHR